MNRNVLMLEVQVAMNKPKSDSLLNTEGWKNINWPKVERYVFKLLSSHLRCFPLWQCQACPPTPKDTDEVMV
jgi:hypothetical protein